MALAGNCSCDMHPHTTDLLGHEVCNAPIIGAWVLAVLIALVSCYWLDTLPQRVIGSMSYSVTYFTYGIMITSGLVVHSLYTVECGDQNPTQTWFSFARLDGSLTSCIATSFFFNALVDIKLMVENRLSTTTIMIIAYFWIFYAYFNDYYFGTIYFYSIYFGCGMYVLIQLYLIINRKQWKASLWLLMASIVGGTSLVLLHFYSCALCKALGAWSIEGIWYYGSDLAMGLLFVYIWKTRVTPPTDETPNRRSIDGKSDYKKCSKALSCEVFPSVDNEKNRVDTTDAVSISLATKV